MAKFKVIVSEPSGKSKVVELDGAKAVPFIGKKLGETIDGSVVGMAGKQMFIAGGSDKDGFPMRRDVHGGVRVNIVVTKGVGFHPTSKGERQRKTIRGSVITEDIVQVNVKVAEKEKVKREEKAEKPKRRKKVKEETVAESAEAKTEASKSGGETSEETAQTT